MLSCQSKISQILRIVGLGETSKFFIQAHSTFCIGFSPIQRVIAIQIKIYVNMSVTGCNSIGIPVILLHDAEGGHVTVELKNGFSYRGVLDEAQDNFNCTLKNCTRIDPKGEETQLEMTLIRGGANKIHRRARDAHARSLF